MQVVDVNDDTVSVHRSENEYFYFDPVKLKRSIRNIVKGIFLIESLIDVVLHATFSFERSIPKKDAGKLSKHGNNFGGKLEMSEPFF